MAVGDAFDDEGIGKQDSIWDIILYLTPRVFEKETEDKALQETKNAILHESQQVRNFKEMGSACTLEAVQNPHKETVIAQWDP